MNKREKEQVEKEIERQFEKASKIVSGYWHLAIIGGLYEAYGYRDKGIKKALKYIFKNVDALANGMISMTDYVDHLKNEVGFKFEEEER